jgi:hypothetical protein
MSNFVAPPQLVENVPYRDVNEMHRFAKRWRDERRKQWFTVPKLSGFCLLMNRSVYDKIDGLDERFGLGLFDDDDLAERARRAGIELAVAHDLFVHDFGSRTFLGNGIDMDGLLEENARRFAAKWGLTEGNNGRQVVALRPWKQPDGAADKSASIGAEGGPCATPGGRGSVRAATASAGSPGGERSQDRASALNGTPPSHVRIAWEGDFDALHSLAVVNRAICRGTEVVGAYRPTRSRSSKDRRGQSRERDGACQGPADQRGTRSCGSARGSCIGIEANPRRPKGARD